jgi:hemin uptake protein HemP
MSSQGNTPKRPPDRPGPVPGATPPIVESRDLLGQSDQVLIHHEGRIYRLQRTRLGKLILTA